MPYPRKFLGEGEDVVLDFHPHWVDLAKPVGWTIVWLVVLGAALYFVRNVEGMLLRVVVVAAIAVVWAATAGLGFLRWRSTEYVLTTDRLIVRQGIISKSGREIPLESINDIAFSQTVFERIVGSGDLIVESAGEFGQGPFHNVPKPHVVQNEIYRQIAENRASMMRGHAFRAAFPPASGSSAPDHGARIPQQIEELARLRDQGLITAAEFDAKKAELLRRM